MMASLLLLGLVVRSEHELPFCGVTISKGSVIGAGSLVNKDIPPFSIARQSLK